MVVNDSTSYVKAFYEMQREVERREEVEKLMTALSLNFDLKFTKTKDVKSPVRGHETDAGIDFFIPEDFEETTLEPNEDILIDSGIKVIVPRGFALIFKEKSGVATKRKLTIGAAVVDSDYRGVVHFHLFNNGTIPQVLKAGDKIVQGIVFPISLCNVKEITDEEYSGNVTERGEGGFGSTGTR